MRSHTLNFFSIILLILTGPNRFPDTSSLNSDRFQAHYLLHYFDAIPTEETDAELSAGEQSLPNGQTLPPPPNITVRFIEEEAQTLRPALPRLYLKLGVFKI